jgi:hypothetical protein
MTLYHHNGSEFDLKLRFGQGGEGELEKILVAGGDKVEVKTEPGYKAYGGNVVAEFGQSDGNGGIKPSGVHSKSTASDWWAIQFLVNRWIILRTDEFRRIAKVEHEVSGGGKLKPVGDNGNVGVVVPLTSLIDPFILSPWERMCPACRQRPLRPVLKEAA